MFVKVQYYKSFDLYAGRLYTYKTELPLEPGEQVIAPTYNEARQKAVVRQVNVEKPDFECREITEYDPEAMLTEVNV